MLGIRGVFVLGCCGFQLVSCSERGEDAQDESAKIAALKAARNPEGETYLDVHFVLGSSVEELVARFGEPDAYRPQLGSQPYGNIKWNDLKGVKVFAILKDSLCAYVNYGFQKMDPFDETRALRIIGVEPPGEEPSVSVLETGVKKWYPFEQYHRLTVSSQVKNVSVKGYDFVIVPGTS
ncbi:MAG: hypothetical protein OXH11_07310 [Candidatus Aminicenantes bacterium]|nr:hypothetical protein [Candidatus Aminicenantes bacterium]